jgi:hypothetical protein
MGGLWHCFTHIKNFINNGTNLKHHPTLFFLVPGYLKSTKGPLLILAHSWLGKSNARIAGTKSPMKTMYPTSKSDPKSAKISGEISMAGNED